MIPITFGVHVSADERRNVPRPSEPPPGSLGLHRISQPGRFCQTVFFPTVFKERVGIKIPVELNYSHSLRKSEAVMNIASGPLKGRCVRLPTTGDKEKDRQACFDKLVSEVINPYCRQEYPQLVNPPVSKAVLRPTPESEPVQEKIGAEELVSRAGEVVEFYAKILEGTGALLEQMGVEEKEALSLHSGLKMLNKASLGIGFCESCITHDLSTTHPRHAVEATIDFAAQTAVSSAGGTGMVGLAAILLGEALPPIVSFTLASAGCVAGGHVYSRYMQEAVNELGANVSQFMATLPKEYLSQKQREQKCMATLAGSIITRVTRTF